ncbi:MAG TPA: M24 family metallopeptidase, partial [Candidatus Bathyarchaeota archaeon]|nr:M24 family metallopeptidase [Candidatus Bathyarchaeota archaeon]
MRIMIDKDTLEKYRQAGEIAAEVREKMKRYVKEGMRIIEICEKAERLIKKRGGKPAFPCNISVNEIAAHYTSPPNDERRIPKGAVVKIDIGVHVDGYVADTAATVSFNPQYEELV